MIGLFGLIDFNKLSDEIGINYGGCKIREKEDM
jgi:hypothetical protein